MCSRCVQYNHSHQFSVTELLLTRTNTNKYSVGMAKRQEKEEPVGSVGVSVRVPEEMVSQIDMLAAQERRTRGNMIRILLEDALKQREGEEK